MQQQYDLVESENTFHPFTRLPIELRQEIWRLSLLPRIVALDHKWHPHMSPRDRTKSHTRNFNAWKKWMYETENINYVSNTKVPTALLVCHDSRTAVLPLYPLILGTPRHGATIRFNSALDTLYMVSYAIDYLMIYLEYLNPEIIVPIKYIAIDADRSKHGGYWMKVGKSLKNISDLKSIYIVQDTMDALGAYLMSFRGHHRQMESPDVMFQHLMEMSSPQDSSRSPFEILDEFPMELFDRFEVDRDDFWGVMDRYYNNVYRVSGGDEWLAVRTRRAWGWRHEKGTLMEEIMDELVCEGDEGP